ncbi:MAG: HDIG domain-containing protein, partial [Planctomycetes bacterium]|nr:HDIG domain-containing protein [Planctomycetota bacterium]
RWLMSQMQSTSTLQYDRKATEDALKEAQSRDENIVYDYYDTGVIIVERGELDEGALTILQAEYDKIQKEDVRPVDYVMRSGVVFFMLLLLAVLNGFYLVRNEPQLVKSAGRLGLFLGLLVVSVALSRVLWFDKWRAEIIPLLATVMVFAIAYNQKLATITALSLCLIVTLSTSGDLTQFVVLMSVAITAIIPLNQVSARSSLIKVGFLTGALYFLISWGTGVIQSQSISDLWLDTNLLVSSLRGAGWCLVVGYLVAGSLPFIEPAFGMVTDMSLLELGDVSHPLLHELVRRAPGTYNHSMSVATIGETAADSIGANGLLVRVGAYFHDIGKMLKPQYFVENMTEGSESRHDHLAPAMSTLIIIGHVKDGVDLARQHNLPEPLVDFIEQHHGTTLVEYFFHEAAKQVDKQPDHKTDAEESLFRYPGPKPQSRESGVMMMADAVESASRTLSDPTPKRIESLVHEITLKRLLDGQFDESSLTLSDIKIVEDSLIKSLIGIYHGRIKYPEQRTA